MDKNQKKDFFGIFLVGGIVCLGLFSSLFLEYQLGLLQVRGPASQEGGRGISSEVLSPKKAQQFLDYVGILEKKSQHPSSKKNSELKRKIAKAATFYRHHKANFDEMKDQNQVLVSDILEKKFVNMASNFSSGRGVASVNGKEQEESEFSKALILTVKSDWLNKSKEERKEGRKGESGRALASESAVFFSKNHSFQYEDLVCLSDTPLCRPFLEYSLF